MEKRTIRTGDGAPQTGTKATHPSFPPDLSWRYAPCIYYCVCKYISHKRASARKRFLSMKRETIRKLWTNSRKLMRRNNGFSDSINVDILLYEADCMMQLQLFSDAELTYLDIQEKNTRLPSMTRNSFPICPTCLMRLVIISAEIMFQLSRLSQRQWKTDIRISVSMQPSVMKSQKSYDKMKEYLDIYANYHGIDAYVNYKYASYYYDTKDYNQALTYLAQGESAGDSDYLQEILYAEIMCYKELQNLYRSIFTCHFLYCQISGRSEGTGFIRLSGYPCECK